MLSSEPCAMATNACVTIHRSVWSDMGVDSIVPPWWNMYACRLAPHIVKPMKNNQLSCLLKIKNTLSYSCSYASSTSSGVSLYLTYHNIAIGEHLQWWLNDVMPTWQIDLMCSHFSADVWNWLSSSTRSGFLLLLMKVLWCIHHTLLLSMFCTLATVAQVLVN